MLEIIADWTFLVDAGGSLNHYSGWHEWPVLLILTRGADRVGTSERFPMAAKERRFNFHWGSGVVAEEARFEGEHHNPAIQLLRYDEGEMAGRVAVRFCFFNDRGRFQRSPLMISDNELAEMRTALEATPELRELLKKLIAD